MATIKSKLGDSRYLKYPSLFSENKPTSSNFSQKPLKKVDERCKSNKNRFEEFYQGQIKFNDHKNQYIKGELDKKEKFIEDLRKQRDRFSLLSTGSKRIINRSKKRKLEEHISKNEARGVSNHLGKKSEDFRSIAKLENSIGNTSIHSRLFQDQSIRAEKRRDLIEKYQKDELAKSKSSSRTRKNFNGKKDLLRLNRSANNLMDWFKNMQQSSQAINSNDTQNPADQNQNISKVVSLDITDKLYEDAKRRRENRSKSRSQSRSQSRNPRTNKYLKDMLEDHFSKALIDRGTKNRKLNYYHTSEMLKDLGFMFTDQDHNDKAEERMLFVDFWRWLRGDDNDGVTSDNLKILLFCIEGIMQPRKPNSK